MNNFDFDVYQVGNWAPAGQFIRDLSNVAREAVQKVAAPALLTALLASSSAFAFPAQTSAESHWPTRSASWAAGAVAAQTEMPAGSFHAFMERLKAAPALDERSDIPDPDPFF